MSDDPKINREQAFQLYATFCGDVERTAHALGVRPTDVIEVADKCKWNEKLKAILALKQSATPGDVERGINRALNFVQAHRYRMFLERVVNYLTDLDVSELMDHILIEGDHHKKWRRGCEPGERAASDEVLPVSRRLSTRALADLASALEKCHAMTYLALSDTSQDRGRREENEPGGDSSGAIHAAIAKAMSEVSADGSPSALLFDAQRAAAEVNIRRSLPEAKPDPYSKDS